MQVVLDQPWQASIEVAFQVIAMLMYPWHTLWSTQVLGKNGQGVCRRYIMLHTNIGAILTASTTR